MYQYQHVIHRMRLGDSDRRIQKVGLMGRNKASGVRGKAREKGWLNSLSLLPDETVLQETFGGKSPAPTPSKIEPYKDQVAAWFEDGIQGTTIYDALVLDHSFTGSYSCVRRYLKTLKGVQIKTSIKLTSKLGVSAQMDFGKGPNITDSHTGKPQKTWIFVMTLAWSRHMYAEIVPNQRVETCHATGVMSQTDL
ncbi:MAG: hypothetical protein R6U55_02035 [Desulfovermiculus sp.]